MHVGCRRVASPYRHIIRPQQVSTRHKKFLPYEKCVWSDSEENEVVSYLLPLLVSAGIMHFARLSQKLRR